MGKNKQQGFTLVELLVSILVLGILAIGVFALFSGLVFSAATIKIRAVASTLATNQMEYLKSLPYDSLAIAGGSIQATNPLPSTVYKTINGIKYKIVTTISYIDDAFDGCGSYPTPTLKQTYCRNYPPPSGSPATDLNPKDYKIISIDVYDNRNNHMAQVSSNISARVAETSSTTGALFVKVIDQNGNPVSGANVQVINTTLNPVVNMVDSTDSNGTAIFYDLRPDTTNYDYQITASKEGYSSLSTIPPSGSLQPNYPNQQVFTQLSSFVTLTIKPKGQYSLVAEATDTNGTPIANLKVYIKGGYKKYASSSNTAFYYDNFTPSDNRPTTDTNGNFAINNLDPGPYYFCGDNGSSNCRVGSTTYYLVAVAPYGGVSPFNPTTIPIFPTGSPPSPTFSFGGNEYLQKVRLIFTTNSSHPRVSTLSPYEVNQSTGTHTNFSFQITGANLPCSSNPGSCATAVKFIQNGNVFNASCTGNSTGIQLNCVVDMSGAGVGKTQLQITSNGYIITIPAEPLGGLIVVP